MLFSFAIIVDDGRVEIETQRVQFVRDLSQWNHSISSSVYSNDGRMNTILTKRGAEEKRHSSVKRGLKVMRMWPLGLRFLAWSSSSTFLCSSSCESVSSYVSSEKEGKREIDSPFANFKHL